MRLGNFFHLILMLLALPVAQTAGQECAVEEETDAFKCVLESEENQRFLSSWLDSDNGVSVQPVYYGEVFSNAHGGIATKDSTHYEGLLDLALSLDFEKMNLPMPGKFYVLGQNTHGRSLTANNVGETQIVSNINSLGNITQISELWWEFSLFENQVTLRAGKQDLSSDFITIDTAADFINSAFGLSPSAGLPTFPAPSPAVSLLAEFSPAIGFKVGVWDAYRNDGNGIFSQNGSALIIGELEYRFTTPAKNLPGKITLGMTYETSGEVPAGIIPRSFGYYLQFEQVLFRETNCAEGNPQGLSFFAQHYPTNVSGNSPFHAIPEDALAGLTYTGLLRGRDEDVAGAGLGWVQLTQGGTNEELMLELFYKAKVNETLSMQPDLQYIKTPSGIHSDALVVGLRVQLDL